MPKYTPAQLRWSEQAHSYVLFIDDQASGQALSSDWLEQIASFAFHSRWGMHYTVRKQQVQRGSNYWYAYRRLHGRIVKRYLGRTTDLTLTRLEEIARLLERTSESRQSSFKRDRETSSSESVLPISNVGIVAPPLLLSKLSPPRLHPFLLERSHLFALLDVGREGPLTLISAPAGFGKTTLVCQWMAARRTQLDFPPVAWITLETADNDPLRFWRYLIAACQAFQVDLQEVQAALRAVTPQPPYVAASLETVLTALLNALAQSPSHAILVLEEYHAITAQAIQETVAFFLDHLPISIHVIIIARSNPPFSLARLRGRNLLCEIRTADLRFSQEETGVLLHHALPFALEDATIQHLHTQMQGWGAGLHLIKLALQKSTTREEGEQIAALVSQPNASLQEFFVSEVLAPQPEPVQQFVLQTSLLTHMTGSLCDTVTEQHNSQAMLVMLEGANLFLEPLEAPALPSPLDSQHWYRYHALFAEAMRNEARRRFDEEQLRQLFVRASSWYEQHGFLSEAIDAAFSVQEYERAAILIARSVEEHPFGGEIKEPHTLQHWLQQLPESILEQNPLLCLSYAATLLFESTSWQPDLLTLASVEKLLGMAEKCFGVEKDLPRLGELFAFRALLDVRKGDTQAATHDAEQALEWLPQTHYLWRGLSLSIVGEKWIQIGQFGQARTALREAYALCEAVKNRFFKRVALIKLAQVCFEQGETQQAAASFRQALAEMRKEAQTATPAHWRCVALLGLAALSYGCNDLESAYQHAQEAITVSQSHHLVYHEVHATLILARVQQAQGQPVVAQQCLVALLDKIPVSSPSLSEATQSAQARLALAVGDHVTVQRWVTGRTPQIDSAREIEEELLVSRWLRTQGKLEEALHHLEHLLGVAQKASNTRRVLEIQVEMVLVAASRKHKAEAYHLLREVLAQAFARNTQRLLLDAGEQMAILLRSLLPQIHDQSILAFIRILLSEFPPQQDPNTQAQAASLVEPLSPQEMRVLRLLAQQRSNADIANELVVSVNTVRSQVQSIYGKLGVHTRNAASQVARELRLIS